MRRIEVDPGARLGSAISGLWTMAAIAMLAVGIAPLAALYWWPFELISHFRVQFVAAALVLLVLGLALGKRLPALLLAAVVAINVWPLLPYLPGLAGTAAAGGGDRLTIVNANVLASNLDHDRIVRTLRASDADVITIVELSPGLAEALAELEPEYPHRFLLGREDRFGLGVLSRYELIDPRPFNLVIRPGIDTLVSAPAGAFRLMVVHPIPPIGPRRLDVRNRQLDRLAAEIRERPGPLVVCGDFNLSPYSPYFSRLLDASETTDTRLGQGLGISWPQFFPLAGIPIDHCLTRGPFATESVERLAALGSDHYPMRVILRWSSP